MKLRYIYSLPYKMCNEPNASIENNHTKTQLTMLCDGRDNFHAHIIYLVPATNSCSSSIEMYDIRIVSELNCLDLHTKSIIESYKI